jgi:GlcNAc-P-P-Und epimerase
MKIAITGGSGFIGTNLLLHCRAAGLDVFASDINPPRCIDVGHIEKVDLCDLQCLSSWLDQIKPTVLIHLGARTDLDGKSIEDYKENTHGVSNICKWLQDNPSCKTALFASSRLVCRIGYQPTSDNDYCPTTPYGESKCKGELIVRKSQLPQKWTIFRPTSIWGPWMGAPYDAFFRYVASGLYFHPKNAIINKSFGFVGNSVAQIMALAKGGVDLLNKKTIYLADYQQLNVLEWGNEIRRNLNKPPLISVPYSILKSIALLGDMAKKTGIKNPPLTSFRLQNLLANMPHETSELQSILPILPYSLKQAIIETVIWMQSHTNKK